MDRLEQTAGEQARELARVTAVGLDPIAQFSRAFDDVFRSGGVEIIRTPFRAPNANAFAERWVGTGSGTDV